MITHYSLRIVGLHYAANPTYSAKMGTVPEMEQRTVEVLKKLNEKRPRVVLIPNPDNVADPHAVMARVRGQHIGYVEKVDQELFYKLLKINGKRFLVATIDSVEVEERGKLYVGLNAEEGAENTEKPWRESTWPVWPEGYPLLPPKEVWNARYEAEHMIDEVLWPCNDPSLVDELECYLNVWMENSLYDISAETFCTCNRYIDQFVRHADPRIREWAARLEKYRTAFYGAKRDAYRMEWWKSLQDCEAMDLLWHKWQYHCSYYPHRGLKEIDDYLRRLPDQLYSLIGTPDCLFKSLFYRAVPRQILWGIYTALLLRMRTCRELGIDMYPLSEGSYEYGTALADRKTDKSEEFQLPEVLCTEEAVGLHKKLMNASMVDKYWQPIGLTNAEKGTLVEYTTEKLAIRNKWKFFGTLWSVDSETLRTAKARGLDQDKTWKFREQLEAL